MRPTLLLAATGSLTFSLTSHTCSPRVDKKISKMEFFLKKKKVRIHVTGKNSFELFPSGRGTHLSSPGPGLAHSLWAPWPWLSIPVPPRSPPARGSLCFNFPGKIRRSEGWLVMKMEMQLGNLVSRGLNFRPDRIILLTHGQLLAYILPWEDI